MMTEVIAPFFFALNNPNLAPQIQFIKDNNPGMTVDVTDISKAALIPICKRCQTDAGLTLQENREDGEPSVFFYRCVVCGAHGTPAATREDARAAWFEKNVVDTN
jgi:hypothetical protein